MTQAKSLPAELTLSDYLTIARKRLLWVVLPIVLLTLLGVFSALRQTPSYQSSAIVTIGNNAAQAALGQSSQNSSFLDRSISNEILLASSDQFEQRVRDELGFVPDVSIRASDDADAIVFTARADSAEDAALHANTWAQAFTDLKQEQLLASTQAATDQFRDRLTELEAERTELLQPVFDLEDALARATTEERIAAVQRDLDRLQRRLEPRLNLIDSETDAITNSITTLQLNGELASAGTATIVQFAAPPLGSSNAPLWRTVLLAFVAGSVLGVAAALAVESMDTTIRSLDDLRKATGHPVLGEIPRSDDTRAIAIAAANPAGNPVADGYHRVRSSLQFTLATLDRPVRTILVTSANQSEGKSTTASNMAWSLAALGQKVLLIDVDFHRPTVQATYEIEREPGLSGVILEQAALHLAATRFAGPSGEIAVLPTGNLPPSPADFLGSRPFVSTLASFGEEADLVVLDAPPVLPVADALTLAELADGILVTAFAGATKRDDLQKTLTQLEQAGGRVLGIVLVGSSVSRSYRDYYGDAARQHSAEATDFIRSPTQLRLLLAEAPIDIRESPEQAADSVKAANDKPARTSI
mgnify:CR=1 FL=1